MRKKILVFIIGAFALGLTACKDEEIKTVEWYTDHPTERSERLKMCGDNPAKFEDNPNCINAHQSEVINSAGSIKDKRWKK